LNRLRRKILLIVAFFCLFADIAFGQELNERQTELYNSLRDFRKPYGVRPKGGRGDLQSYPKEDYYIPQIKERFLELLTREWNQEEIEAWIDDYADFHEESFIIQTERVLEKDTIKTFQEVYDSIKVTRLEVMIEGLVSSYYVPSSVIAMAGWIDMPETIPYLEALLKNPKQQDKEVIKLALARLRVEPYYSEALEKYTSKEMLPNMYSIDDDCIAKTEALWYLGTEESIYAIAEWLLREELYYPFSHGEFQAPVGTLAFDLFYKQVFVENKYFREKYLNEFVSLGLDVKPKMLKEIYDWMQENRGKVEYNRDY